jgi:hypothetical protein
MSSRALGIIFCAVFFPLLLSQTPLSAAIAVFDLSKAGVGYTRAEGTLWNGRIAGLAWRGRSLGDAEIAVNPFTLVLARVDADVAVTGGQGARGRGTIMLWPTGSVTLRDVAVDADVALLPILLPVKGSVSVSVRHADFDRDGCRAIDADVRTDALTERPAGIDWRGPVLSGQAQCRAGVLVVPIAGGEGSETIAVTMRVSGDGTFDITVDARTGDEKVKSVLSALGFTAAGDVMTLAQSGHWSKNQ